MGTVHYCGPSCWEHKHMHIAEESLNRKEWY